MKRFKPIAGILLIFILGTLTGVLAQRFLEIFEDTHPPPHRNVEQRVKFIMVRLTDDLELSPAQQKEIHPIVAATEEKVRAIRDEYAPRIQALHDAGIAEIKTRLNPGQQAELDRMHAEWMRRRQDKKSR